MLKDLTSKLAAAKPDAIELRFLEMSSCDNNEKDHATIVSADCEKRGNFCCDMFIRRN